MNILFLFFFMFTWVVRGWVRNSVTVKTPSGHSLKGTCALVDFLLEPPRPPQPLPLKLWVLTMKTQEPTPLSSPEEKEKQLLWNTVSALLHNKGLFSREKYFDRACYETLFQLGKETWYPVQTLMHVLWKGSEKMHS